MMEQKDIGNWTNHIRDVDRQWLAYTFEERMKPLRRILRIN